MERQAYCDLSCNTIKLVSVVIIAVAAVCLLRFRICMHAYICVPVCLLSFNTVCLYLSVRMFGKLTLFVCMFIRVQWIYADTISIMTACCIPQGRCEVCSNEGGGRGACISSQNQPFNFVVCAQRNQRRERYCSQHNH